MAEAVGSSIIRISRRALFRIAGAIAATPASRGEAQPAISPAFNPFAGTALSGPSSKTVAAIGSTPSVPGRPYVVPTAPGWSVVSLLTAGNTARSGYPMTGLADGLGVIGNGDGTITLFMNHEIEAGHSVERGHGGRGAFVSRWRIDIATLEVLDGSDMVSSPANMHLWSGQGWVTAAALLAPATSKAGGRGHRGKKVDVDIDRLCSADAAPISAFWDGTSRLGYEGHIFLNGEESETRHCRAFAWVDATRSVYQLPAFSPGKFGDKAERTPKWENLLANPTPGPKTVVLANSDGGPNQIYAYIGSKQAKGSPVERAGLVNGKLFSLRVAMFTRESREKNLGLTKSRLGAGNSAPVSLVPPGHGTSFLKPEDGAWDPRNPNVYYFATSDRCNYASPDSLFEEVLDFVVIEDKSMQIGRSRLWAVTFDDVQAINTQGQPTARIQLLLDGTEGGDMFDNITVDRNGVVYLCEDTGEARHNAKIWAYDTKTGSLTAIAKLDPALFGDVVDKVYSPPTDPFGDDKETSGVLDVTGHFELAPWFKPGCVVLLAVVQPHFDYDSSDEFGKRLYEGGQLTMLIKTAPGT